MSSITRNELKELLDSGEKVSLVDALPLNYYAEGHIPGAISLPPGRVAELAPALLPDKERPVVVYCSSSICQNSAITAEVLRNLGYADVRRYAEGKEDWKAAGLPLEKLTQSSAG
ncbi:MAG TPA: rhodanese-like domain-containing protein [Patescibacteria group bacterium]|nr:rhodanese-like domain-containing protein [Patescibacteria group bacterium]